MCVYSYIYTDAQILMRMYMGMSVLSQLHIEPAQAMPALIFQHRQRHTCAHSQSLDLITLIKHPL